MLNLYAFTASAALRYTSVRTSSPLDRYPPLEFLTLPSRNFLQTYHIRSYHTDMASIELELGAGVPEIVRLNFKALHDVVKAHGEALKAIEKAVTNRVSRPEHLASLQEKVSVGELTSTFQDLSKVIDNKADARDTSAIVERMASRAELQGALAEKADVSEVQRCLDAKAGAAETQQLVAALEARLGDANGSLHDEIASRASASSFSAELATKCTHKEVRMRPSSFTHH